MLKEKKPKTSECPVETTLSVIGGKWKSIVLYYLLKQPVMRFSDLRRVMPSVTHQMLAKQLRELESDGLIHRTVYPQVPPKVEYSLTEFGLTLEAVILAMKEWGRLYSSRDDYGKKN
ncbi:MAG TPA: helix-turn-helix domain-containing protein [Oculatellaceae cyanobacterium]|jgi:DNA-binding HxlR family transcriptional regulator